MSRTLRRLLVITGDHGMADPTKWDGAYAEADLELHRQMADALESLGRWEVAICSDHTGLLRRLEDDPPDLVFNLCDTGFRNVATHELHLPALLELLRIPYSGSPPAAMVIAYDKMLVNLLAGALGVPVPREQAFAADRPIAERDLDAVVLPALVKPAQGDGSVGINRGAVVRTAAALRRQLDWFRETLPGRTALVQEYLPGGEYGLALIGNPGALSPLRMMTVDYGALPPDLPPILAFESKTGPVNPYTKVGIVPAELDDATVQTLVGWGERLFERIGLRDYARFDFRTAADGTIRLMEVNPNPAWSTDGKLAMMAAFDGIGYPQMLERLIDVAWARVIATPPAAS